MNACFHLLFAALLFASSGAYGAQPNGSISKVAQLATPVDSTGASGPLQEINQEIESLKATITTQAKELAQQRGAIEFVAKRPDNSNTAVYTAASVVVAAIAAGLFALWNQNKQADQERLLKAIEIIMDSRSPYQADRRRKNLSVFLNDATNKHLEKIENEFSGPEFTDLHVALAQAMAEKANTPEEVFRIWTTVLKEKKVFTKLAYPEVHAPT